MMKRTLLAFRLFYRWSKKECNSSGIASFRSRSTRGSTRQSCLFGSKHFDARGMPATTSTPLSTSGKGRMQMQEAV